MINIADVTMKSPHQAAPVPLLSASSGSSSADADKSAPITTSPFSNTSTNANASLSKRQHRRKAPATNCTTRINSDVISTQITALHAIPYVHGAYASASPAFVRNSKFCHVLKRLLPGAYDELHSLMKVSDGKSGYNNSNRDDGRDGGGGGLHRGNSYSNMNNTGPDPVKVMKWAENNPVVSAFGIWTSDSGRRTVTYPAVTTTTAPNTSLYNDDEDCDEFELGAQNAKSAFRSRHNTALTSKNPAAASTNQNTFEIRPSHNKPALEWDVFLDPKLVRQVSNALEVVDGLESKIRVVRSKRLKRRRGLHSNVSSNNNIISSNNNFSSSSNSHNHLYSSQYSSEEEETEEEYDLYQSHTAAQIEVDRLVTSLMKRMILAHGSMSQLVLEAFGVAKDYNYKSVVRGVRVGGVGAKTTTSGSADLYAPSRRREHLVWNKAEEERDLESLLLNPHTKSPRSLKEKTFVGSRGIFMENWLNVFSQTLMLLKNHADPDRRSWNGNTTSLSKKSSTTRNMGMNKNSLRIETTQSALMESSLTGLLRRMWFTRKDSSFALLPNNNSLEGPQAENEGEDDSREEIDYDAASSDCATISSSRVEKSTLANPNIPSLLDVSPRSNDSDAYDDMFAGAKAPSSSLGALCGMSLCLTGDGDSPSSRTSGWHVDSQNMSRDVQRISDVLGEPLRLVLDLKSRRVPPKVWSRLIDSMRSRGLVVEGIGSFDMDELRVIAKSCPCPLTPILFFHSVGDLQRACHANEVKKGDTVYFNGGSLMWKPSTIMEAAERGCCGCIETPDMDDDVDVLSDISINKPDKPTKSRSSSGKYSFQPYAYPRASLSDWERVMCKSTLECYQKHFNLKVGVYVQEFSISPEALDALACFVNAHGALYDQGLAFGGINGVAIKHIHGDGYWNQRYVGRSWDFNARPANHMMPLKPEDHHIVQKAIQAGAWAQVASTYEVTDEQAGALTIKKREPCNPFLQPGMGF
ncbi:hypothetical protein ACHAWO_007918 [Cyclotella atomus]|uniref:Uncharacterized protein n=1 Tax=Cyclotella atomus TaxID=382360 RepID=A0ABD3MLN3_9STRA